MSEKILIIPTYNERKNVSILVKQIIKQKENLDILFVDGNSTDGTTKILRELEQYHSNVKVIYEKKKEGLAKAYIKGFRYALDNNYQIIIQMDGDLQHQPKYISTVLKYIKNTDVVVVSRNLKLANIFKDTTFRKKISILSNIYINFLTGMNFKDTLSGFKCYKREVLKTLNWNSIVSKEFIFQTEILYKIWKKNFKIKQIPFSFSPRRYGNSKISIYFFLEALVKIPYIKINF